MNSYFSLFYSKLFSIVDELSFDYDWFGLQGLCERIDIEIEAFYSDYPDAYLSDVLKAKHSIINLVCNRQLKNYDDSWNEICGFLTDTRRATPRPFL